MAPERRDDLAADIFAGWSARVFRSKARYPRQVEIIDLRITPMTPRLSIEFRSPYLLRGNKQPAASCGNQVSGPPADALWATAGNLA
jgi:hypothetical protein